MKSGRTFFTVKKNTKLKDRVTPPVIVGKNGFAFVHWSPLWTFTPNEVVTEDMKFTAVFRDIEAPKIINVSINNKDIIDPDEFVAEIDLTDNDELNRVEVSLYRTGKSFPTFIKKRTVNLSGKSNKGIVDFSDLALENGNYYISIRAYDKTGNFNIVSVKRYFEIKETEYIVEFEVEPEKGNVYGETTFVLKKNTKLKSKVIPPVVTGKNGFAFVHWSPLWTLTPNNVVESDMLFTAIFKDIQPPKIKNISINDGDVIEPDELEVTIDLTDNDELDKVEVKLYKEGKYLPILLEKRTATVSGKADTATIDFKDLDLEEGKYRISIRAYDKTGNYNLISVKRYFELKETLYTVTFKYDDTKGEVTSGEVVYTLNKHTKLKDGVTPPEIEGINGYAFVHWSPLWIFTPNAPLTKDIEFEAVFLDIEAPKITTGHIEKDSEFEIGIIPMKLRVSDNENVARVVVSLYKKGSIKAIETETIKPNVNDYQIEKMFNIIEPGKYYITVRAYDNVFNREYKQIKYFTVVEPEIPIVEYSIQFNVDSDKGTTTDTTVFKGIEGKTYFDENIVAPVVTAKSGFEFEGWDPVFIETDKIESDQIFHAVFKEVPVCVPAKVNQMNILKTDNRYGVVIKLTSPVELYATANHWKGTWQSEDAGITWTNYALGNIPSGQGQDPHVTFKDSCGNLIEVNYDDLKPYIKE